MYKCQYNNNSNNQTFIPHRIAGPTSGAVIILDMICILFGGYLFFAFLYYVFRPSTSSATKEARKVLKDKDKVHSTGQKLVGSALGYILINQLQIIALILSNIAWSPDIPGWLVDILTFVGNIFSIDLGGLLSSPDCVGNMNPLSKWLVSLALPWCLAVLFVLWYGIARCFKKNDEIVVETILHSAVQVLLIGLFTTVVKTCFEIFDCSPSEPARLIMDPSYHCSDIGGYRIVAIGIFFTWAVLPFLKIGTQLSHYKWKGTLKSKMVESSTFRIMYGWAVNKYRTKDNSVGCVQSMGHYSYCCCLCWAFNPYLWEIFNAVIKGVMAVGSVTMFGDTLVQAQFLTILLSLILHLIVRPFKNTLENVVVILFCIVDLFGILSFNRSSSLQTIFIVASFLILIFVSTMAIKATRASIKEKRLNGLFIINDKNQ